MRRAWLVELVVPENKLEKKTVMEGNNGNNDKEITAKDDNQGAQDQTQNASQQLPLESTANDANYDEFWTVVKTFATNTVVGWESGTFKICKMIGLDSQIGGPAFLNMILHGAVDYFNRINDWMRDRTDDYINKFFDNVSETLRGEVPCCFLEALLHLCVHDCVLKIDHSLLDRSSVESYLDGVRAQVGPLLDAQRAKMIVLIGATRDCCSKKGALGHADYVKNPFKIEAKTE